MDIEVDVFANPIRVMIVDDSLVIQKLLERLIAEDKMIKVVERAFNGKEAISDLTKSPFIDVVLLDLQMPVMGGLEAIPLLLKINPKLKIIIVSSIAAPGAEATMNALSSGASDYIEKPNDQINIDSFAKTLLFKIKILGMAARDEREIVCSVVYDNSIERHDQVKLKEAPILYKPSIVAIASSTGGPRALMEVLGGLSKDFLDNNMIIITQHIKDDFLDLLIKNINSISKLNCKKASHGDKIEKGNIYIAPSELHFEVVKKEEDLFVYLSDAIPENFCKPSADPMFRSLAKLPINSLAIVLTGIGSDGLSGAIEMAEKGNVVIAQDKETSVVWGMPGAVANAGICSAILPLHKIASYIERGGS